MAKIIPLRNFAIPFIENRPNMSIMFYEIEIKDFLNRISVVLLRLQDDE